MTREERIRHRAENYIRGEITLADFNALEELSIEENEEEQKLQERIVQLQEAELEEDTTEPVITEAVITEAVIKPTSAPGRTHTITLEDFNKLPLAEQQEIANSNEQGVKELINGNIEELSYKLKEEPIIIPKYSYEEFRELSLAEASKLYEYDRQQYNTHVRETERRSQELPQQIAEAIKEQTHFSPISFTYGENMKDESR